MKANVVYCLRLMKYEYAYKTSDGARHVEEMDAPSREAVFAALRARGIKAIKVVATEGGKANGEVRVIGVRKRVATALVVVAALVAASLTVFVQREEAVEAPVAVVTNTVTVTVASPAAALPTRLAAPLPRQAIPGDRRRIENAPTNLFAHACERILSKFAEPGRGAGGVAFSAQDFPTNTVALLELLNAPLYVGDSEFTEYVDLKRITAGIKHEMRAYIRGGGTAADYLRELVTRQELERSYREKAERRLQTLLADTTTTKQALYDFWLKANAQLQSMGIYALPLPDALRDFQTSLDFE